MYSYKLPVSYSRIATSTSRSSGVTHVVLCSFITKHQELTEASPHLSADQGESQSILPGLLQTSSHLQKNRLVYQQIKVLLKASYLDCCKPPATYRSIASSIGRSRCATKHHVWTVENRQSPTEASSHVQAGQGVHHSIIPGLLQTLSHLQKHCLIY